MATESLTKAIREHASWLRSGGNAGERLILSCATLEGWSAARMNLAQADFRNADLAGAVLIGSNLSGANFERANLTNAKLVWANFLNTSISECKLDGANLSHARNLTCAQIASACLGVDTILPPAFRVSWISGEDFECISLVQPKAELAGKDFRHDDLAGAKLQGADMQNCRLMETNLRKANLP